MEERKLKKEKKCKKIIQNLKEISPQIKGIPFTEEKKASIPGISLQNFRTSGILNTSREKKR